MLLFFYGPVSRSLNGGFPTNECSKKATTEKRFLMIFKKQTAIANTPVGHMPFSLKIKSESITGTLFCPFEPRTNLFIQEVQGFGKMWALEKGMVHEGDRHLCLKLEMGAIDNLCAYSYPEASLDDLKMAIKWVTWLFVLDDDMDYEDTEIGRAPEIMAIRNEQLISILEGNEVHDTSGLAEGLRDFYKDISAKELPLDPFIKSARDYLSTCVWEADNRKESQRPLSGSYERMRLKGGAAHSVFEVGFLMESTRIPRKLRTNALFSTIAEFANMAVCLVNDIFSCKKELKEGVVENLVILLQLEESSTFAEAILETSKRSNKQVESYLDLKANLHALSTEPSLQILEDWIVGNLRWSMESQRYK